LYFWGASARKHAWFRDVQKGRLAAFLVFSLLLTAGWRWGMHCFFAPEGFPGNTEKMFYAYTSPTIAAAALCLLLLHERGGGWRCWDGLMAKAASAALGVFLLHTTVWGWLIAPNAALLSPLPQGFAWLNVLLSALVITLLCIPIDLLRAWIFEKLGARKLTGWVQEKVFSLAAQDSRKNGG
jgi:hypothetical protein